MAGRLGSIALAGASQLARLLATAVLFILLARLWPPAQFGQFALLNALAMLLGLIAGFGFPTLLMRQVGLDRASVRARFATALRVQTVLAVPCGLLAAGLVLVGAVEDGILFAALLAAALLFQATETLHGAFRGLGRFEAEAGAAAVGNLLFFLLPGAAALTWPSPHPAAVAMAIARLLQLAIALWLGRRFPAGAGDRQTATAAAIAALPYAAEAVLAGLLLQADVIVVAMLLGDAAAGLYQAGSRLVLLALLFAQAVANATVPSLAAGLADGGGNAVYRPVRRILALYGAAGFLLLALAGDVVVAALYGPAYAALGPVMPLFGLVILARCLAAGPGILLIAAGEQAARAALGAATGLLYLALAVPAALGLGIGGVALANAGTMALLGLLYHRRVRARLGAGAAA